MLPDCSMGINNMDTCKALSEMDILPDGTKNLDKPNCGDYNVFRFVQGKNLVLLFFGLHFNY